MPTLLTLADVQCVTDSSVHIVTGWFSVFVSGQWEHCNWYVLRFDVAAVEFIHTVSCAMARSCSQ